MDLSSSEDEDEYSHLSCESALGNPLILQRIFAHLPTQFLLSSVSLVNSFWNQEARSFIRDYRICLKKPEVRMDTPCKFIAQLDKLCVKTTARGRQIPWNGLKVCFHPPEFLNKSCSSCSSKSGALNFKSDIKLKHLDISWLDNDAADCKIHCPLQALFRHCAPDLTTLRIETLHPQSGELILSCLSGLPKLEEIDLSTPYLTEEGQRSMKMIVRKLVEFSPNLKKVTAKTVNNLALYPEKVYGLLDELEFRFRDVQDVILYQKVTEKLPAIKELVVSTSKPTSHRNSDDSSNYDSDDSDHVAEEEVNDEDNLERQFHNVLEPFLRNCCSRSLRKMEVRWVHPLDYGLAFPMLVNLTKLTYTNHFDGDFQGLWSALVSVDYDQNMPNLEQLKIVIGTVDRGARLEVMESAYDPWPDVEPELDLELPPCSTSGKLNLKLELEIRDINWSLIQSQFPNIPSLHIKLNHTSVLGSEPCPVSEVCRLWPDLKELTIMGHNNELKRNYDADFCGIHEEEAELLGRRNKKYLKNVQIVPIQPCLLTMSNLGKVCITMGFKDRRAGEQDDVQHHPDRLQFISRVTRLVTLGKMEHAAVWDYASSLFKSDSSDDGEDDDDVELFWFGSPMFQEQPDADPALNNF